VEVEATQRDAGEDAWSVFDSLVEIAGIVQWSFLLEKKPLRLAVSAKSRIETAASPKSS
jgi:hypothetical protein